MALQWKSILHPSWPKWVFLAKLRAYPWKSLPRVILLKILAIILSLLFVIISLFFLAYASIEITTNIFGVEAQVANISSLPSTLVGKYRLDYQWAGLFKAAVIKAQVEYPGVYCLYPAWPNSSEPNRGDPVKVWPTRRPLVAAPPMQVIPWIVSVIFLIVGLMMFEFSLLALTIH